MDYKLIIYNINEQLSMSAVPNPWAASSTVLGREQYNIKYYIGIFKIILLHIFVSYLIIFLVIIILNH